VDITFSKSTRKSVRFRTFENISSPLHVAVLIFGPFVDSFAAEGNGGKEMYLKYCGSCHGSGGKGDGPVSRDLKVKVPDLTLLRSKNKGIYPTERVMSSIDGSRVVRAHGDRNMPVWGEVFREEHEKEK
jgi:hypothetical protein